MGRIHLLEDEVINKIAAGEVVERPASVVKELIENAIDAGADQISVSLELGGSRTIAVTDNGSGMGKDDAVQALTRHATSKIRGADDLFHIHTMGFRGEALASISAVSRFSLATSEGNEHEGVKVSMAGGEGLASWPWSGQRGTTVAVENLFFNMPVRAKFLKAPATEFSHCLDLVQALSLCHPEIGFVVTHNSREHFRVAPQAVEGRPWLGETALRERAKAVVGKDAGELLYVRSSSRFGDLEALISPPGLERPTGKQVFTFVNGRWVKDKTLRYGILRGYHSHILKGKFPVAIAHLTMDPTLLDVNVHPAKTELRFQYPSEVQNLIALAIREKLRDGTWAEAPGLPTFSANRVTRQEAPTGDLVASDMERPRYSSAPRPSTSTTRSFSGASRSMGFGLKTEFPSLTSKAGIDELLSHEAPAAVQERETAKEQTIPWADLQYIGTFDRCFLIFEVNKQLLLIDQHAFHERILFERLLHDEQLLAQSQALLVPESVSLTHTEVANLRLRRAALAHRGFDFQVEDDTTIVIRAIPSLLAKGDLMSLFSDLAQDYDGDDLEEPTDSNGEMARLVLAKAACHAAVRAGEELTPGELTQLLQDAQKVDFVHNCPHGRRVFRWWTRDQVARMFDR